MRRKSARRQPRPVGGDKMTSEVLALTLHERATPWSTTPRQRCSSASTSTATSKRPRSYIGRRHVSDERGDPVVIDWRAELSGASTRQPGQPASSHPEDADYGVRPRRTHGVPRTSTCRTRPRPRQARRNLQQEIERPRVEADADIVATIQPEQDELVRANATTTVCVQGAPGPARPPWACTGPPAAATRTGTGSRAPDPRHRPQHGLPRPHRCGAAGPRGSGRPAYHRNRPGRLGGRARSRPDRRAVIKGDARMATVLRRAVWSHVESRRAARGACAGPVSGGCRPTWSGRSSTSCASARSATAPRAPCCPSDWRTSSAGDGALGRLARRPGAGRRGPQQRGPRVCRWALARGRLPDGAAPAAVRPSRAEASRP